MRNKKDTKNAVMGIAKEYGFIEKEIMNQMAPNVRLAVEESMLARDKKVGHAIKTLAKHIYASDACCVFELLQNADNNHFTNANAQGESPFIAFKVHPNRIVVECNEDGVTASDLSAICTVGESTRSTSPGYIGARGLGFKSVFIAAWKVHIQSGHFSFSFQHKKGDRGLGMVQPVWEDTGDVLPNTLTRMTLYLHEEGDPQEIDFLRQTIFKQLNDLQQACLLFLRNLKEIRVFFYNDDGGLKNSKKFSVGDIHDSRYSLETEMTDENGHTTVEYKHYHVTRQMATDLPKRNNRDRPDTEEEEEEEGEATRAALRAEIALAFPLTHLNKPLLERQDIFAFLPIRESGFKFLIHSDFDTTASRQDISNSRRNRALQGWISQAFLKAVLEFCEDPDLCYSWPRFLPVTEGNENNFWSDLSGSIKQLIHETPILKSQYSSSLRKIDDIVIPTPDFMDENRSPLLEDSTLDPFLSNKYPPDCVQSLKPYGLESMSHDLVIRMLRDDLENQASKMKSEKTSAEWHSHFAKLLLQVDKGSISKLALIPLRFGKWVSVSAWSVYMPTTNGIPIPPGVDMQIIESTAVANKDRHRLFTHLGATEAKVYAVRQYIHMHHDIFGRRISRANSIAHLRYLYLTHVDEVESCYKDIAVHSEDGHVGYPHREDFYLRTGHPYGPESLLPTDNTHGLQLFFLHPEYLEDATIIPSSEHRSWRNWLRRLVHVHKRLSLISRDWDDLSESLRYVAEHRPERFLGLLGYLWKYDGDSISRDDELVQLIKDTNASSFCMTDISPTDIDQTFLPLPGLQQLCSRFMEENEPFPFLKIDEIASSEELSPKWMFLHTVFSVGKDDNLEFFLKILWWINAEGRKNPDDLHLKNPQRILDLYITIDSKCLSTQDPEAARSDVREYIEDYNLIFTPHPGDPNNYAAEWFKLKPFRWDSPSDMLSTYCLKHSYSQLVDEDQLDQLSRFMKKTMSIPDCSWEDMIIELEVIRDNCFEDLDRVFVIYEWISKLETLAFVDELRNEFQTKDLIFVVNHGEPGWYKSSECLWSTIEIRGKVTLNGHYEDLENFFIESLGIKTLTLQMVYDELLQAGPQMTHSEIKAKIWSLNALLQTESGSQSSLVDPDSLMQACVLPIINTDGTKSLVTSSAEFAIADQDYLAVNFQGRIKLLDYSLEDVEHLSAFFKWAKLTHRYLSTAVRKFTYVPGETTRVTPRRDRDLTRKAHGLVRVAATFNSPRYRIDPARLYEMLRTTSIEMANGITSVLSITQDGNVTEVEESTGSLHINETPTGLTIYVPLDKKEQELCFSSLLSVQLTEWLMQDPITQISEKVDSSLLTAITTLLSSDPSIIDMVLALHGISGIELPNQDPIDDDPECLQCSITPDLSITTGESTELIYTPSMSSSHTHCGWPNHSFPTAYSPPHPIFSPSGDSSEQDTCYRTLLNEVTRTARRASFP